MLTYLIVDRFLASLMTQFEIENDEQGSPVSTSCTIFFFRKSRIHDARTKPPARHLHWEGVRRMKWYLSRYRDLVRASLVPAYERR
jgi:hypothetical protein